MERGFSYYSICCRLKRLYFIL